MLELGLACTVKFVLSLFTSIKLRLASNCSFDLLIDLARCTSNRHCKILQLVYTLGLTFNCYGHILRHSRVCTSGVYIRTERGRWVSLKEQKGVDKSLSKHGKPFFWSRVGHILLISGMQRLWEQSSQSVGPPFSLSVFELGWLSISLPCLEILMLRPLISGCGRYTKDGYLYV